MKKTLFVCSLIFYFITTCNMVWADFYVIAAGKKAKRTVLVSPKSTAIESGTALLNALNNISDASETNPYLIIIEPGIYDTGANNLQMKPYVDIQGSGENVTKILGTTSALWTDGVIKGSNNVELCCLTIEDTDGGQNSNGILNDSATLTIRNVTVKVSNAVNNVGIYNVSSTVKMTDVTITLTTGHCVFNQNNSTVIIKNSEISGATAVRNYDASSNMYIVNTQLDGAVSGTGCTCAGVYDENYNFYPNTCPGVLF